MLADYTNSAGGRLEKLKTALDAGDPEDYRIHVHALKSISKTIGADAVSALAKA